MEGDVGVVVVRVVVEDGRVGVEDRELVPRVSIGTEIKCATGCVVDDAIGGSVRLVGVRCLIERIRVDFDWDKVVVENCAAQGDLVVAVYKVGNVSKIDVRIDWPCIEQEGIVGQARQYVESPLASSVSWRAPAISISFPGVPVAEPVIVNVSVVLTASPVPSLTV